MRRRGLRSSGQPFRQASICVVCISVGSLQVSRECFGWKVVHGGRYGLLEIGPAAECEAEVAGVGVGLGDEGDGGIE